MTIATYFDGRSTRAYVVQLAVEGEFLHITGDGVRRIEVLRGLRFTVAYAKAPSRVDLPGGASLEIADPNGFLALRLASGGGPSLVERLEASLRYALAALGVILLAGISAYVWGVPIAADLIVEHAPRSLDARLAKGSIDQLESFGWIGPEEPLTARERTLSTRFAELAAPTGVSYHLIFRSFKGGPNAFALPDGTILMSKEIEDLTDNDDALLFVLGHELGHLRYRHGIKGLARATMTSMIMMWYVGDVSSAVAVATAGVANLSYSRSAEAEADRFGSHLLHQNGLSTKPAAVLFEEMEVWVPKKKESLLPDWVKKIPGASKRDDNTSGTSGDVTSDKNEAPHKRPMIPTYLSTHPATAERIKMLEQDKE